MNNGLWRDGWLLSICVGRIFTYANFMVYAACLPILREQWTMSATQAGTVASGYMLGYTVSLVASSWLAERFGPRRIFVLSAVASVLTAIAFGFFARDYTSGLMLYTLAALTQGGNYTPAIMLMAERYRPEIRGSAVGWLIASTSMGYAFSLAVSGSLLAWGGYSLAFIGTGVMPALGAVILWAALRRVSAPPSPNRKRPTCTPAIWNSGWWKGKSRLFGFETILLPLAVSAGIGPSDDLEGSAEYKRHPVGVFLRQALPKPCPTRVAVNAYLIHRRGKKSRHRSLTAFLS